MNQRGRSSALRLLLTAVLVQWLFAEPAAAQNWDHAGQVLVTGEGWIPTEKAQSGKRFKYQQRWFAEKYRKKLEAWQKEDLKHAEWSAARQYKTKHYRVVSNVPRFLLETEINPFLDELYRTYVKVFKQRFGLSAKAADMNLIKIYNGYQNYAEHEAEDGVAPARTEPGYFTGNELVVFYDPSDPAEFYGTVFHEGAHQFVQAVLPGADLPVWLDEAIATYFEACTYSRETGKIVVDGMPWDRIYWAKEILGKVEADESDEPLAEKLFFRVEYDSFDAEHYALAWSFLHFLIHREGGKHKNRVAKFLRATNGSGTRSMSEVFKKSTGQDLKEVQDGWRDYVMKMEEAPQPEWVLINLEEPDSGVDLARGDLVWSFMEEEILHRERMQTLWNSRPRDVPLEMTVVRRKVVGGKEEYRSSFVSLTIPAGSGLKLTFDTEPNRGYNLRD